jgi:hypothetical protein
MSTPAEPSRENWRFFVRPAPDVGVVDVRVFWIPCVRSPAASAHLTSGKDWQHGTIVVHRVMVCAPPGISAWTLPTSPTGESDESVSVTERVKDAFDDYVANKLVGPAWKKSSEVWVTPVCEDMAAAAERIGGLRDQWHDLTLGKPVQYLAGPTPLSDIATELPLPGDLLFTGIKRLVQFTGIFVGLATGQPLLTNACLKSYVHDVVLKTISKAIGDLLTNTLEPVGDLETTPTKEELKQQTAELKEALGIAHGKQQESEKAVPDQPSCPDQAAPPQYTQESHVDSNTGIVGGRALGSSENQMTQTNETLWRIRKVDDRP